MKKQIEKLFRQLGLERLIFYYVFLKDRRKNRISSEAFEKDHPSFKFPPPFLRFDVTGTSSASSFYETGKNTARQISQDLQRYFPKTLHLKVLEWGCGPGRLLQHMHACNPEQALDLYGVDMYHHSIVWALNNLSETALFLQNRMRPPLLFDQNTFDVAYAVSVFTHLSEQLSRDWMNEIIRILKPGGIFWFSAHSGKHHHGKLNISQREKLGNNEYVAIHSVHIGSQMFEGIHPEPFMIELIRDAGGEVIFYQASGLQEYQDVWVVKK